MADKRKSVLSVLSASTMSHNVDGECPLYTLVQKIVAQRDAILRADLLATYTTLVAIAPKAALIDAKNGESLLSVIISLAGDTPSLMNKLLAPIADRDSVQFATRCCPPACVDAPIAVACAPCWASPPAPPRPPTFPPLIPPTFPPAQYAAPQVRSAKQCAFEKFVSGLHASSKIGLAKPLSSEAAMTEISQIAEKAFGDAYEAIEAAFTSASSAVEAAFHNASDVLKAAFGEALGIVFGKVPPQAADTPTAAAADTAAAAADFSDPIVIEQIKKTLQAAGLDSEAPFPTGDLLPKMMGHLFGPGVGAAFESVSTSPGTNSEKVSGALGLIAASAAGKSEGFKEGLEHAFGSVATLQGAYNLMGEKLRTLSATGDAAAQSAVRDILTMATFSPSFVPLLERMKEFGRLASDGGIRDPDFPAKVHDFISGCNVPQVRAAAGPGRFTLPADFEHLMGLDGSSGNDETKVSKKAGEPEAAAIPVPPTTPVSQ